MNKGIIGKKIGMTQIFDEKGNVIPVTVIETAGNIVSQIKTVETDGYNAIQLGYGEIKDKHINKPFVQINVWSLPIDIEATFAVAFFLKKAI